MYFIDKAKWMTQQLKTIGVNFINSLSDPVSESVDISVYSWITWVGTAESPAYNTWNKENSHRLENLQLKYRENIGELESIIALKDNSPPFPHSTQV